MTNRELVEKFFIELGFENENPDDLDKIAELVDIWKDGRENDVDFTEEQLVLLNDTDVIAVLNRCKEYYEPKKKLTKGELRQILQDIATATIKRKGYDFKMGCPTEEEPSFGERMTAIKMLQSETEDDSRDMIQFIDDIGALPLDVDKTEVVEDGNNTEET